MIDFTNFTMLGSWVLDVILILISASACFYCALLSRRLKALNALDGGVGASIVSLTDAIGKTHDAARDAQSTTHETVQTLQILLAKCESMAPNIEASIAQLDSRINAARKLKLQVNEEAIPGLESATSRAHTTAATLLKMLEVVEARSHAASDKIKLCDKPLQRAPAPSLDRSNVQGLVLPQVKLKSNPLTAPSSLRARSSASRLNFSVAAGHDFNAKVAH